MNAQSKDIIQYCELIAGHLMWLFIMMSKVLMKMSESEKADQGGVYSSILVASCKVVESITQRPAAMLSMRLVKRVSTAGNN